LRLTLSIGREKLIRYFALLLLDHRSAEANEKTPLISSGSNSLGKYLAGLLSACKPKYEYCILCISDFATRDWVFLYL